MRHSERTVTNLTFKKLGFTEPDLDAQARMGNRIDKRSSKLYRSMHDTDPPSDEEIQAFEFDVGALPEDYKAFLKRHNGGTPSAILLKTRSNERVINTLLALKAPPGFQDSIAHYRDVYDGRIPRRAVPIASAGSSDLILLDIEASRFGQVLYWDHNLESDDQSADDYFENTEWVAASFSEFLGLLKPDQA